jgi:hypothetical protein
MLWNIWKNFLEVFETFKKNAQDVNRLYWSTHDIHRNKPFIQRHAKTVKDTAKTLHKYVTMRAPKILCETDVSTTYVIPININHAKYKLTFTVLKNTISNICGAWAIHADGRRQEILAIIKKFAGPNEDWLCTLTPEMIGFEQIEIAIFDKNTFDIYHVRYSKDEKMTLLVKKVCELCLN